MRWASLAILAAAVVSAPLTAANGVEVKVNEAAKRVDITIDGKPFTS
jgi:ribose 5-phosphate isomerase